MISVIRLTTVVNLPPTVTCEQLRNLFPSRHSADLSIQGVTRTPRCGQPSNRPSHSSVHVYQASCTCPSSASSTFVVSGVLVHRDPLRKKRPPRCGRARPPRNPDLAISSDSKTHGEQGVGAGLISSSSQGPVILWLRKKWAFLSTQYLFETSGKCIEATAIVDGRCMESDGDSGQQAALMGARIVG